MKIIERLLELQELELGPKAESPEIRPLAEALRKGIPEPILGHYDRLRSRGKKGVALVRHGVCSGCQMRLASGIHAALQRDDDIATCDTCARYLLLVPEPPAVPEPPPVARPVVKRGRRKKTTAAPQALA
jgi:predicted  nucleic acid-binding Zn-ribbon protein